MKSLKACLEVKLWNENEVLHKKDLLDQADQVDQVDQVELRDKDLQDKAHQVKDLQVKDLQAKDLQAKAHQDKVHPDKCVVHLDIQEISHQATQAIAVLHQDIQQLVVIQIKAEAPHLKEETFSAETIQILLEASDRYTPTIEI